MNEKKFERLFFALWPDDAVRQQIVSLRKKIPDLNKGRILADGNLHLTLHFLGNIPSDRIDCFLHQAQKVRAKAFNLSFSTVGFFKKPKVVWLGCDRISNKLVKLHQQLGEQLKACEYEPEKRTYSPHMTLARKIYRAPEMDSINPIEWEVSSFVLVQSVNIDRGVEYRVKATYPLG